MLSVSGSVETTLTPLPPPPLPLLEGEKNVKMWRFVYASWRLWENRGVWKFPDRPPAPGGHEPFWDLLRMLCLVGGAIVYVQNRTVFDVYPVWVPERGCTNQKCCYVPVSGLLVFK